MTDVTDDRRKRARRSAILLALFAAAVYVAIPFSRDAATLMVLSFCLGLGLGVGQPMVMSLLHSLAPPGRMGEAAGVRMSLINSMAVAVPRAQYRNNYIFSVSKTYTSNFVNVVAPSEATVLLDGEALPASEFADIGTTGYRVARKQLPPDAEIAARVDEMGGLLERTVSSTRRIAADLRPLILDDLGLAEAAAGLVEDFQKRSGIACGIKIVDETEIESLSKAVAVTAYRAIQESLTNVARHAAAKNVWILVGVRDTHLEVEIEDDGRGIAPEDFAKPRSLGLKGMRERIAFVGGSLDIGRAPRGGTRVRLSVPVQGLAQEQAA